MIASAASEMRPWIDPEGSMKLVLVALSVCAWSTVARADDLEQARALHHEARQDYDLGEYQNALEKFKRAYRLHEDPTFLFNIAQCHRQLGDKQAAIRAYRTYLIKTPDAANREQVRDMIGKLEKQLAEEQSAKNGPPTGTLSPGEHRGETGAGGPRATPRSEAPTADAPPVVPSPIVPPPIVPPPVVPPPVVPERLAPSAGTPPDIEASSAPPAVEPSSAPPSVAPPSTPPSVAPLAITPPLAAPTPVYKRAWFWSVIGGVTAAAVVGLAVGVTFGHSTVDPTASFGTARGN
jgi:hypothetical protein